MSEPKTPQEVRRESMVERGRETPREHIENQQEFEAYGDNVSEFDREGKEYPKHSQEYELYNDVHDRADADGAGREYVTNGQEQERYRDEHEPVAVNREYFLPAEKRYREEELDG